MTKNFTSRETEKDIYAWVHLGDSLDTMGNTWGTPGYTRQTPWYIWVHQWYNRGTLGVN